jgi:hypothetical protein
MTMTHTLYASLADLLAHETLSTLLGRRVEAVELLPRGADASAYSGSAIEAARVNGDGWQVELLLKRISAEWDYFMRVTEDKRGREVLVWQTGLLDRLPPEVGHAYVACCADGEQRWAILMRDVSQSLLSSRPPLSLAEHRIMLDALAALHATFWDDPHAAAPEDGFNHAWHHYHIISPDAAAREADGGAVMPRIVRDGWERLPQVVDGELAATLLALTNDPQPLVDALERLPQTVVHADVRAANLGLELGERPRLLILDWALVGRGVAALDMIWYLAGLGISEPHERQALVEHYRAALERRLGVRFAHTWWQAMLDLSMLGGLIRYGWIASRALAGQHSTRREQARADLDWLLQGAMAGLERL